MRCAYTLCLTSLARRSPSTFRPLFHPIFAPSSSFFAAVKEKESRRAETRFYLILECAPQLDEFSRADRASRSRTSLFQTGARCWANVFRGGMELERIDERLFVYGIRGDVAFASRGIRLRGMEVGGCWWKLLYERLSGRVATWLVDYNLSI